MNENKNNPAEKRVRAFSKKQWLQYLLVYLVCLLAACLAWLLVRYTMSEETTAGGSLQSDRADAAVLTAELAQTDTLYG